MDDLAIYFGGSISGGREYVDRYIVFCERLSEYGTILTDHVADPSLDDTGEDLSASEVYERDVRLLDEADVFVADVSMPSLGVGYEVRYAEERGIPMLLLYHEGSTYSFSSLLEGNPSISVVSYTEASDALREIDAFVKRAFGE